MTAHALLSAALRYAADGWFVFPLFGIVNGVCECPLGDRCGRNSGKHPRTEHGLKDATTNEERIRAWWKRWPEANIGVVTGSISGIYVIDIDNKTRLETDQGLVGEGEESLRRQEAVIGELPTTRTSITGSGGYHVVFTYPTSPSSPPGTVTFGNQTGILPSVDIRGDGGYIVVPPSRHLSGSTYQWIDADQPFASLSTSWTIFCSTPKTGSVPLDLDIPDGMTIEEGAGRNDWLFRMGAKLRGQHGLSGVALLGAMAFYNDAVCSPPLENREVQRIADSVSKYPVAIEVGGLADDAGRSPAVVEAVRAISFLDLITQELTPFVKLVEGILHQGEMLIIGGPPNVGKTWLAMDLMLAVASGGAFLGKYATRKAPVLFIDEEGSQIGNQERFRMLLEGRTILRGDEIAIHLTINAGIRLDTPAGKTALVQLIEELHPAVVVLDSLIRVHGGDENSSQVMASVFRMCKYLMQTYGCALACTHHSRKPGERKEDPLYMLRGSSDIQGFADSIIMCLPTDDSTEMVVHHTKMRHGQRQEPFAVGMQIIDTPNGRPAHAILAYRDYDPRQAQMQGRGAVLRLLPPGATRTAEQIAYEAGMSLPTAREHLKILEAGGAVAAQNEAGTNYYRNTRYL